MTINLSDLENGTYFLAFQTNKIFKYVKFIIY
ncbi:MAG: hypothetical protein GXO85_10260 [Chlorobi bacterium]|nr:hypothetical protein [Chlorobiota bacterium]